MTKDKAATTQPRFLLMSVPDNTDGAFWFVFDRFGKLTKEQPTRQAAAQEVKRLNNTTK